jgi:hypothetical protein
MLLTLVGVLGLLIKRWAADYISEFTFSYLGNLSASFSVYFIVSIGAEGRINRLLRALTALIAVEAFELTDGFGIMSNVYDPLDLVANLVGIVAALGLDHVLDYLLARRAGVA